MNKICVIVAAGSIDAGCFNTFVSEYKNIYYIAVDGGYAYLKKQGIVPALAVGDFDSLGYVPTDTRVVKHPVMKDQTDMLLAIDEAVKAGFLQVYVFGAVGGERLDHTIANIQMLSYAKNKGCDAVILDKGICAFLITKELFINNTGLTADNCRLVDGYIRQRLSLGSKYLSLLSYSNETTGVSIKGCKYEIEYADMNNAYPLGVSNEISSEDVCISLKSGMLLVILIS